VIANQSRIPVAELLKFAVDAAGTSKALGFPPEDCGSVLAGLLERCFHLRWQRGGWRLLERRLALEYVRSCSLERLRGLASRP